MVRKDTESRPYGDWELGNTQLQRQKSGPNGVRVVLQGWEAPSIFEPTVGQTTIVGLGLPVCEMRLCLGFECSVSLLPHLVNGLSNGNISS
jgi:hypothetical protein